MAEQLHEAYRALPYAALPLGKAAAATAPADLPWAALARPLARLQIRELAGLVLETLAQEPYLLGLDSLEHVTPTHKALLLALVERAQVVGATNALPRSGHLARLWWSFKRLEVPPLDDAASRTIIERFLAARLLLLTNPHMFRKHALKAAGGNPQALADLLTDADKERLVTKALIRDALHHDAGARYFDLTPLAVLGICGVMAARFLARGLDSTDLYLLASATSAFLLLARMFLTRGAARSPS